MSLPCLLKGAKTLINRVVNLNSNRNIKKNVLRVKSAIKKLNLILNSSWFYIHPADKTKRAIENFQNKIKEICDRLFSTLPPGESIQLELFDEKSHEMTLKKQSHSCGQCGLKFLEGEKVELHHIDSNHNNWDGKNLLAIHSSCHHYVHMGKNRKDLRYSGAQCGENRTLRSNGTLSTSVEQLENMRKITGGERASMNYDKVGQAWTKSPQFFGSK